MKKYDKQFENCDRMNQFRQEKQRQQKERLKVKYSLKTTDWKLVACHKKRLKAMLTREEKGSIPHSRVNDLL